ncbi:hypothetical protein COOONC_28396 [Cooperia oncophora]
MPLSFFLKAKETGVDLDNSCKEMKARKVFDASGNQMNFPGCMETEVELIGGKKSIVQMHVKRLREDVTLLEARGARRPNSHIATPGSGIPNETCTEGHAGTRLCQEYSASQGMDCTPCDLVRVTMENSDRLNNLQIENARLRKKFMEKRREELYGSSYTRMEVDGKGELVETKDDPVFAEWTSRAFNLKYPRRAYNEGDRKEILAGYLGGEAKLQYNTLPDEIKNGSLDTVVQELKTRIRMENQESQAEALRAMRMLRKKERQSVIQFCLELELLSAKAHPNCDQAALELYPSEIFARATP